MKTMLGTLALSIAFLVYANGQTLDPVNLTLTGTSDTTTVNTFPWISSNTLFFTVQGSGDFVLAWPNVMSLRFRDNERVALMRSKEGLSESIVLAEYSRTNLYKADEQKTYWFNWGGGFAMFGENTTFGQNVIFHRRNDWYDRRINSFTSLQVKRMSSTTTADVNILIYKPFAVPFITHWYKLNDTDRNVLEGHLLDSDLSTCAQVPDEQQMLGPFRMMFRVVKFVKANPVMNLKVDLYGNQEACSKRTHFLVETEERTDTLTAGKFLKCSHNDTLDQSGSLKVCHYDCACVVDCKYLQLTVDNTALGPEICEVVITDTTP